MKRIVKMYRCYTENGTKYFPNPRKGVADADEVNFIFNSEPTKIVDMENGMRAIQCGKVIYTDNELRTDENGLFINLYQPGDCFGRPTGKLVKIGEEVL